VDLLILSVYLIGMDEEFNPNQTTKTGKWTGLRLTSLKVVKWSGWLILVFIFSMMGVILYNLIFPAPVPVSREEIDESIEQAVASATAPSAYSAQVYQVIFPSLVVIQTQRETAPEDEKYGVGSGVVINEAGEILTAFHVVDEASVIEVLFADGSQATAKIISSEPEMDIAVLHPDHPPDLIVPAVLGNPGAMRIGDEAYAVGNPLGLTASMSAGVISGFNRSIPVANGELKLEGLIQFDTAVNPGNSGGPLLNRQGQVVGIVTALANPSEQNFFVGIGFAVPIGTAVSAAGGGPSY
jgi:S1-C subfamily serine protease